MTIAIIAKVQAGVVLGADSASSYLTGDGRPEKVYYSAHKVFQMHEALPIGGITWGLGMIGTYSISALMKDLRERFEQTTSSFHIDPAAYTMKEVAEVTRQFIFEVVYRSIYTGRGKRPGGLGLLVAGYSASADLAEEWLIEIDRSGKCGPPTLLRQRDEYGIEAFGQPDAFDMLVNLRIPYLEPFARLVGIGEAKVRRLMTVLDGVAKSRNPVRPGMPIRDVIELVCQLASTEVNYRRFLPYEAAPTVGGPIEVLAITRHSGVRWVHQSDDFRPALRPT